MHTTPEAPVAEPHSISEPNATEAGGAPVVIEGVRQIRGTSTAQVPDADTCLVTSGEGVPTGAQLFEYCGDRRIDCTWTPPPAVWERVKSHASARGVESRHGAPTKISLAKNTLSRGLKVRL